MSIGLRFNSAKADEAPRFQNYGENRRLGCSRQRLMLLKDLRWEWVPVHWVSWKPVLNIHKQTRQVMKWHLCPSPPKALSFSHKLWESSVWCSGDQGWMRYWGWNPQDGISALARRDISELDVPSFITSEHSHQQIRKAALPGQKCFSCLLSLQMINFCLSHPVDRILLRQL